MSPRRLLPGLSAAALVALSLLLGPAAASAEPGPITLASTNGLEQANVAVSPALAADGHYLAFAGRIGGLGGIFRKDLTNGEVVPVRAAPEVDGASDASAPSISADGRFISFTTRESLDPTDDPGPSSSDVYVADMATTPPTYTLVSARDGSSQGLAYEGAGGSVVSPEVGISANGDEVVFVTTVPSDLTGVAGGNEAPALQVAVRDIAAHRTILISAARDPLSGAMQPTTPVPGGAAYAKPSRIPGAAISADGSTVAWIGTHVPLQAATTPAEAAAMDGFVKSGSLEYNEPLWRRVPTEADPAPETRRMVSGALLAGMLSGENQKPYEEFCGGADAAGWDLDTTLLLETTPALSANGDEVAVIGQPATYGDAYLFDLTGQATVRQLTRAIPPPLNEPCQVSSKYPATAGAITSIAVSPAGDRVALTTARQRFPIAPPTLVGSPPVSVGLPELYLADLSLGTLQRLTHGTTESEPSLLLATASESLQISDGATSVSFDATGETLAFSSRAANLVPGDGNGTSDEPASDAFLVSDPRNAPSPGSSSITPRPPSLRTAPRRALTARATSRPDGTVRVAVTVPAAGRLKALASTNGGKGVKPRRVATASRRPMLASTLAFSLKPARRFRARVHAAGGVEAKLRLEFRGPDGKPLQLLLHVRFHAHAKKKRGAGK